MQSRLTLAHAEPFPCRRFKIPSFCLFPYLVYAVGRSHEQHDLSGMLWRMGDENYKIIPRDYVVESIKAEIEIATPSRRQRIFEAIALAALGSIPWIGGVIAASASAAAS
jgi:hypothetical protein